MMSFLNERKVHPPYSKYTYPDLIPEIRLEADDPVVRAPLSNPSPSLPLKLGGMPRK